jgi:phage protein U
MAESPDVMMVLGTYAFALSSAAYQEFTRSSAYTWAEQPLIGGRPALQFTGIDAETVTLRGTIYPTFRGGLRQVDAMRALAGRGAPLRLVSGLGSNLGAWVIEKISEGHTVFFSDGTPRKIDFDLTLKRYA